MQPDTAQLFDGLCRAVHATPDRRGWVHTTCPECGKEGKHFGFHAERGCNCFVCGFTASLRQLAERLNAAPVAEPRQFHREPPKPKWWQQNPRRYLDDYCAALDRVQAWQNYKPLTLESISRWQLGVGRLPSSQCEHRRLVYPLFLNGQIVGFRGRAMACDCPKWLTCGGSQTVCVNLDLVTPGAQVVIVENPVDAFLVHQETPEVIAVASTAGAGTWRPEWTTALAAARPSQVIVWLDNDMVGCPNLRTYKRLRAAWEREHPGKHPPEPNGPRILRDLRAAQLDATMYRWPDDAPAKYDVGSYLMDTMEVAA